METQFSYSQNIRFHWTLSVLSRDTSCATGALTPGQHRIDIITNVTIVIIRLHNGMNTNMRICALIGTPTDSDLSIITSLDIIHVLLQSRSNISRDRRTADALRVRLA